MQVSLLVDTFAPIPTASFLAGEKGGPLFRTIRVMPRN